VSALIAYAAAYTYDQKRYIKTGFLLVLSQLFLSSLASFVLFFALITGYFKMEYVAKYTDISLPFIYKISGFWAGQEGSLFLWAWLLIMFSSIELFRTKKYDYKYTSIIFIVLTITSTFFLFLTTFIMNPFKELDFFPSNGLGMNPLLQNPGMIYHPPTLYIGFVGFTIAFAYSVASLLCKEKGASWLKETKIWNIIIWLFLTIGIVLGGQWAYVELGWGGYWAWDPVENASLLPWLTATAFLHAAFIYEKKNLLKAWTNILILLTFELSIFGTFLTRSGIIDSVHSFGKSSLGGFFIWFIILSSGIYLYIFFKNKPKDKYSEFPFFSKEGFVYITNWLFTGLMIVVLFGSTLPIFTQLFMSEKSTVNISYYNKVTSPFFIALFLIMGICTAISYRKINIKKTTWSVSLCGLISFVLTFYLYTKGYKNIISILLLYGLFFALSMVVYTIITSIFKAGFVSLAKGKHFYASMIIHCGVIIMAFGIVFSAFYKRQVETVVSQGENIQFDKYVFNVGNISFDNKTNYVSAYVPIKVYNGEKYIITLKPERRFYNNREESFGEVSIYTKPAADLYLILASYSKPDNYIGLQIVILPFVSFIWIGFAIMIIGGLWLLFPLKRYDRESAGS
jgi:cytochrome c-type biogenesis protein CcmF